MYKFRSQGNVQTSDDKPKQLAEFYTFLHFINKYTLTHTHTQTHKHKVAVAVFEVASYRQAAAH